MKKSQHIELALMVAIAGAALVGCNAEEEYQRDWQHCVDSQNRVVDDKLCDETQRSAGGGYVPYYHWLYAGQPYGAGNAVVGGYTAPRVGAVATRASSPAGVSIIRGGFGSTAHTSGVGA